MIKIKIATTENVIAPLVYQTPKSIKDRESLLSPFHRWENRGFCPEKLSDLTTHLGTERAEMWPVNRAEERRAVKMRSENLGGRRVRTVHAGSPVFIHGQ